MCIALVWGVKVWNPSLDEKQTNNNIPDTFLVPQAFYTVHLMSMNLQVFRKLSEKKGVVELFQRQMFLSDSNTAGPTLARFPLNVILTYRKKLHF